MSNFRLFQNVIYLFIGFSFFQNFIQNFCFKNLFLSNKINLFVDNDFVIVKMWWFRISQECFKISLETFVAKTSGAFLTLSYYLSSVFIFKARKNYILFFFLLKICFSYLVWFSLLVINSSEIKWLCSSFILKSYNIIAIRVICFQNIFNIHPIIFIFF